MNVGARNDSIPRRPVQPETSQSGIAGGDPEPRPSRSLSPAAFSASSVMSTPVEGEPFTRTRPSTSSRSARAASSTSSASSSSWLRTSIAASTTARPLLIVVCEPDAPASHGPASVSW